METVAYIHLALAYETPASQTSAPSQHLKVFQNSCLCLVSVMTALVGISSGSEAEAKILRLGDNGPEVVNLQQRLQQLGYFDRRPTGFFREITREAVVKFQQSQGLIVDGVVGPQTEAVLMGRRSRPTGRLETPIPTASLNVKNISKQVLQRGNSGSEVRVLQQTMQSAGIYNGPVTGYFGSLTEAAIEDFQKSQGLKVDGIYGSATRSRLQALSRIGQISQSTEALVSSTRGSAPSSSRGLFLQEGDRGDRVTQLQQDLQSAGVYNGPVTGYFGSWTKASVTEFQRLQGLKVDGIVGPVTLSALAKANSSIASSTVGNESVLALQQRLRSRGFYTGPLDGKMGPLTEQAIAAARQSYGLSAEDIKNGRF